jgi:NAD(P)-dependent dehydrogenase (short-subunit alcohol dehydrogenase family)
MVSYVVTGASRGIGLAFVQVLHARLALRPHNRPQGDNPQDCVFAIVQDLNSCDELKKLAGPDFHIIPGDLDKPETLRVRTARCHPIAEYTLNKV